MNRIQVGLIWTLMASLPWVACQSVQDRGERGATAVREPVQQTLTPGRRRPPVPKPTELPAPHGDPVTVGCSDGQREGFIDGHAFPSIAGCSARWKGALSLRRKRTDSPCGDDAGPCLAPQDACADTWHLCGINGDPEDLRARVSAAQCSRSGPFAFLAGLSHVDRASSKDRECGPKTSTAQLACLPSGWGAEPVCCGEGCGAGMCRNAIWAGQTQIVYGAQDSCARFSAEPNTGILCCKN